jgi:hypothetical protein
MRSFLVLVLVGSAAAAQSVPSPTPLQQGLPAASTPKLAPELPPVPKGDSTVMGGVLEKVDLVRDQFQLHVYGGQKVKILFDDRTQAMRDGKKISVLDLKSNDRVSVETTLDGTAIFALRVHIVTKIPQGEVSGQIVAYEPETHQVTISESRSSNQLTLDVPPGTPVTLMGQNGSSSKPLAGFNYVPGSIVDAKFKSARNGHGALTSVSVYATVGTTLTFRGHVSSIDMHTGKLVMIDPETDQIHTISFDPAAFPKTRDLQKGASVKAEALFTGSAFMLTQLAPD